MSGNQLGYSRDFINHVWKSHFEANDYFLDIDIRDLSVKAKNNIVLEKQCGEWHPQ